MPFPIRENDSWTSSKQNFREMEISVHLGAHGSDKGSFTQTVWPGLAKFRHFGKIFKVLSK